MQISFKMIPLLSCVFDDSSKLPYIKNYNLFHQYIDPLVHLGQKMNSKQTLLWEVEGRRWKKYSGVT